MSEKQQKPLILLVEDDPLQRLSLSEALREAHFEVTEASDVDEAKRYLLAAPSALEILLTDVHMPGSTDGIGLAVWVSELFPAVMIVVMSGMSIERDRLRSSLPGAIWLDKPIETGLLPLFLGEALKHRHGGREQQGGVRRLGSQRPVAEASDL